MKRRLTICLVLFLAVAGIANAQVLKDGWLIQSSAVVEAPGEKVSSPGFDCSGWYRTSVPSTVLGALVKNGVYQDVFFGKNLETISHEPFHTSWWYRKEFTLDRAARAQAVRLIFDGINYSANVFLNGKKIADADSIYGAFRRFDVDVTGSVMRRNVLAVQVFPPKPGDFTIGFVDWNPVPPDRNMGLWREVQLRATGAVSLEDPFVQTKIDLQSLKEARLTVSATLVNHSARPVSGKISGEIEAVRFAQNFQLGAGEKKEIRFAPEEFAQLVFRDPRLWWPNNQGSPELYNMKLTVSGSAGISDSNTTTFGIREVSDYINEQGHRGYIINGRKVLIRGGGWADDLLLNEDEKKLEWQIRYVKQMNLNTIRLEGIWGSSQKMFDLADRYGILLMVGWSCQWEWPDYLGKETDDFGGIKTPEDMDLAVTYLHDQVLWLRNHPSIFVWAVGSDTLPRPELEKRYRAMLTETDPTRPMLISTKGKLSEVSGPSAVKMNGPYDYVTPNYWYLDRENGGAFGFNTETGPGPQPPPVDSIERMFSTDHWWPVDDAWNFHCARNEFATIDRYMNAFNKRYGPAENLPDFAKRAQAANYEAIRAMFEAFGIRKPETTGIVQWMLNASWPKMYWQLYDYYMMPGGAFYGTREACQPVHISYDYGKQTIHVVNDTYTEYPALKAVIKVLSPDSSEILSRDLNISIGPNESKEILQLANLPATPPVYFVDLQLYDADGRPVDDNFYWLSAKQDVLDPEKTEWFVTPNKEFADFTPLKDLAPVNIQAREKLSDGNVVVTLHNPTQKIAFFIEAKLVGNRTGRSILPILWNDNYVTLLPGETKELTAQFDPASLLGEKPMVKYTAWNATTETLKMEGASAKK